MRIVNHQEHCGEYRYCPGQDVQTVSLRGECSGQDGLRFSIKGAKIRMGYFFRVAGMLGRRVRERIAGMCHRYRVHKTGYHPQDIQRVLCCARL